MTKIVVDLLAVLFTPSQLLNRRLKQARRAKLERQRAENRANDQRDYLAARARKAGAGTIGAALR